jgi:translocation and assembly module TamB
MSGRAKRAAKYAMLAILAIVVAAAVIGETGLAERWVRGQLITQIERRTGARVELGAFHFHLWGLRAELDDLTLHGLEAAGQPALFHADRIDVKVRILSFFGRQVALDELIVERPEVAMRIDRSGHSNLPTPQVPAENRPWRETLFQLRIAQLSVRDGSVSYNDQRTPLSVDGQDFDFTLHYDAPGNGADSYVGVLGWQQVRLAAKKDMPFRFDLLAKFVLHRDSFEMD